MTWPARTWVDGETFTASLGNNYLRDPFTDLRGGGIAITSQAANDFIYASSATQLGRLAAVSGRSLFSDYSMFPDHVKKTKTHHTLVSTRSHHFIDRPTCLLIRSTM